MIEIKNIFKSFGKSEVLHDISARFERGKTNLIIGLIFKLMFVVLSGRNSKITPMVMNG